MMGTGLYARGAWMKGRWRVLGVLDRSQGHRNTAIRGDREKEPERAHPSLALRLTWQEPP